MKTGLESLDVGAPDITYSGNQGPKSPQEDQRMMQKFQMAQLEEEYEKHVFEMEEMGLQPMTMQQFMEQAMSEEQMSSNQQGIGTMMQEPQTMAADGGVMQLVKNNKDGSRPGYRGDDAARSSEGTSAGRADPGGSGRGDTRGDPGNTGGSDREDNPGDRGNFNPTTGTESQTPSQYTPMDIKEQVAIGNVNPDGTSAVNVGDDIPFAKEFIGGTEYDVIPNDPVNEEIRRKANEAIAEERRLAFEEEQRRRREEERLRLQGLNRDRSEFVATQMPDEEDEEDDEEEDADNDARTQRLSLPFDFSVNTKDDLTKGRGGFFYNDGGRAGYAEGGAIYPRLGTLSSGVQSAEQQLQTINASLQKAESNLGSDSPGGGSSLAGGPSFTSNFEDANNQGPGSNLLFGGSSDGTNPFPGLVGDNTLNNTTTPFGSLYGGDKPISFLSPMPVPGNPELAGPVSSIGGRVSCWS